MNPFENLILTLKTTVKTRFYLSLAILLLSTSDMWSGVSWVLQCLLFASGLGALICFGLLKSSSDQDVPVSLTLLGNFFLLAQSFILILGFVIV